MSDQQPRQTLFLALADSEAKVDWHALLLDALGKSAARYDLVRSMFEEHKKRNNDVDKFLITDAPY